MFNLIILAFAILPVLLGPRRKRKVKQNHAPNPDTQLSDGAITRLTYVPWVQTPQNPKISLRVMIFSGFVIVFLTDFLFVFQFGAVFLAICCILEPKSLICKLFAEFWS